MERTIFELVTPESLVESREVGLAVIPASNGNMGIKARHAPTVSTLRDGVVRLYEKGLNEGISSAFKISGGFVEVTPERCVVLCETAELL